MKTSIALVFLLPMATSALQVGKYLNGLPGKTFTVPIFTAPAPTPVASSGSASGFGAGYLSSLPGKVHSTPVVTVTPAAIAAPVSATSGSVFGSSYLNSLPGKVHSTPTIIPTPPAKARGGPFGSYLSGL